MNLTAYLSSGTIIDVKTQIASIIISIIILSNIAYIIFTNKLYKSSEYNKGKYKDILLSLFRIVISIANIIIILFVSNGKFDIPNRCLIGCDVSNWNNYDSVQSNILLIAAVILSLSLIYMTSKNMDIFHIIISLVISFVLTQTLSEELIIATYNGIENTIKVNSSKAIKKNEQIIIPVNFLYTIEYNESSKKLNIISIFDPYEFQGLINEEKVQLTKKTQIENILNDLGFSKNTKFKETDKTSASFVMDSIFCTFYELFGTYKPFIQIYTKESYNKLKKQGFKEVNDSKNLVSSVNNCEIFDVHNYQTAKFQKKEITKWPIDEDTLYKYIDKMMTKIKNNQISNEECKNLIKCINICLQDYVSYHSVSANNEKPTERINNEICDATRKSLERLQPHLIEIEILDCKFIII